MLMNEVDRNYFMECDGSIFSGSGLKKSSGHISILELKEILKKHDLLVCCANIAGNEDVSIVDICVNTRNLKSGSLFICRKGKEYDSHALACEAVNQGAKALIVEKTVELASKTPILMVNDVRMAEAVISSYFFEFPDEKIRMYGVTGTNGKTTITSMIHHVLSRIGKKGSLFGTVKNVVVDRSYEAINTTPTAMEILRNAKETLNKGGEFVSMEVSSHALAMKRVESLRFDYSILTNITHDHLDFHKDMEQYKSAKYHIFDLMKENGTAIVNIDDAVISENMDNIPISINIITYGMYNESRMPDYSASNIKMSLDGLEFDLFIKGEKSVKVNSQLIGDFNVSNILAVIALLCKEGYSIKSICEGIKSFSGVEGRFELYPRIGQDIDLVIDFAHTPDALEKTLKTAKKLKRGRLVVVFGAGGEADMSKRPMMGKVVSEIADVAIITADNPKKENPMEIIKQIESGFKGDTPYLLIEDRDLAIEIAINLSSKGDMLILAGKGHETTQIYQSGPIQHNDRLAAFNHIRKLKKHAS